MTVVAVAVVEVVDYESVTVTVAVAVIEIVKMLNWMNYFAVRLFKYY